MKMLRKIRFWIYLMIVLISLNLYRIFLGTKTATTFQAILSDISRGFGHVQTANSRKVHVDDASSESETRNISSPINLKESIEKNESVSHVRPFNCNSCFRHEFVYLIQNEDICSEIKKDEVDLIIFILTRHKDIYRRNVIRTTWASISRNNTGHVRYVFLLGEVIEKDQMETVYKEAMDHKDMLMEDFRDSYYNLTYKTIMGLKWVSSYCDNAKFVLKTDDDMWVNVPEILRLVNRNQFFLQSGVLGRCGPGTPIRDKNSKSYISYNEYPLSKYRSYCSGSGYVTSMAVAKQVYNISRNVPFLKFEDLYFGECVQALKTVGFMNTERFLYLEDFRKNPCILKSQYVLTCHGVPLPMMQKIMGSDCSFR